MRSTKKDWLTFNLLELSQQLRETINFIEDESEIAEGSEVEAQLAAQFEHMYHHLNSAWNGRFDGSLEDPDEDMTVFYEKRKMPEDISDSLRRPEY